MPIIHSRLPRHPSPSVALLAIVIGAAWAEPPLHVYLTWQGDTATTITVNYQTAEHVDSVVRFDIHSEEGRLRRYEHRVKGASRQIPGLEDGRYIHTVELTGLQPDSEYYFVAGDNRQNASAEFKFRTAPADDSPFRFVTGGDMDVGQGARRLLEQAAKFNPLFVAVGGDLAYANGDLRAYRKWDLWLANWAEFMVLSDGRMVPMVLAIGNHEVQDGYNQPPEKAPFYFGYFAQNGQTAYFSRQFGANFALLVLDSGHTAPHGGPQAEWLDAELARLRGVRYIAALYHVPLYPTHRDFMGAMSAAGREHWLPLFDKYGLTVAFENHDHTHKRTHRLKNGQVDPEGTLYLGDGCFGVNPRQLAPGERWYEAVASSTQHFWVVDVSRGRLHCRAVNANGMVFDEAVIPSDEGSAEVRSDVAP